MPAFGSLHGLHGWSTATGGEELDDEAYGVGWNGSTEAPTKNAVYDKIEAVVGGSATIDVQEGDASVVGGATALDFDASDFNVTDTGGVEANIALNYGTGAGQPAEGDHAHAATYQPLDADLTDIAAIADASGDIIIRGAAGWERLPKGTDGEVLKLTSGLPAWETDETGAAGSVDTANTPNALEYARFTDADTIEGRTEAEFKGDFNLETGVDVQAWSANLDEYAAVNPTAAGLALLDDANAAAQIATLGLDADIATFALPASTTISAFGATLVDDADNTTARATLGLTIGTHVQAFDADLTTLATAFTTASGTGAATLDFAEDTDNGTNRVRLAGAASTADVTVTLPATTGTVALTSDITLATLGVDADLATFALPASTTISAFGATLVDDANAAAALATLVLDADLATFSLPASTTISAYGASLIDDANEAAFKATANLETGVDVQAWDTTLDSFAAYNTNGLIAQTAANTFAGRTITGTANKITVSDGNGVAGNPTITIPDSPTIVTPTIASFTNAAHNHTNAAGGAQLTDAALSAAVGIAKGGTGQTTAVAGFDALAPTTTQGDLIYHDGSDNIRLAKGTAFQHLRMNSGATAPEWAAETKAVNITIGDGTNEIPDGIWCDFDMPVAGTFIRWRLMATKFTAGSTGSIVLDLWADTFANFPPVVGDSISTSKPTITTAASAEDSTITDWTPEAFAAGQTFRVNVDSCTTISLCTLSLWFTVP